MTFFHDIPLEILGRNLQVNTMVEPEEIRLAVAMLENTFRDMERVYELRWGTLPSALDTSSWLLMGALNMAHRVVCLEKEASQHANSLKHTIDNLLSDVPDEKINNSNNTNLNIELPSFEKS